MTEAAKTTPVPLHRSRHDALPPRILLASLFGMGLVALIGLLRFLVLRDPLDPWEAAQVGEAWRAAHHLPVYERPPGHATHMYGPLVPWLLGALVRVAGPSVYVARAVSVVSSIALVSLLAWAANRMAPRPLAWRLGGLGLLLAIDAECVHYFVRGRPDMLALLVATLGLVALYRWDRTGRGSHLLVGSALLVLSVFLKQSTAVLTGIPFIAIMLERRPVTVTRLALSTLPALAVVAAIVAVRVLLPTVYHYMIAVPAVYGIEKKRLVSATFLFLGSLPLFWIIAAQRILARGSASMLRDVERWAIAAIVITVPTGAMFVGKLGGVANSWLPALFAVVFFILLQLPRAVTWLSDARLHATRRLAIAATLSAATLVTMPSLYHNFFRIDHATEYGDVVNALRQLPTGRVVSPRDVLIPLIARDDVSASMHMELDAGGGRKGWQRSIPARVAAELDSARYVVMPPDDWFGTPLVADSVASRGFTVRQRVGRYIIWERQPRSQIPSTLLPSR